MRKKNLKGSSTQLYNCTKNTWDKLTWKAELQVMQKQQQFVSYKWADKSYADADSDMSYVESYQFPYEIGATCAYYLIHCQQQLKLL